MQGQIQDPIKHQDLELFGNIFKGSNPWNTVAKFLASGVWQRPEFSDKYLMIINYAK